MSKTKEEDSVLEIKNISKKYLVGNLEHVALNNISINFRDNEFVAILGPSGSGKTTLLNVIGGLDNYDSGNLIINSISTKEYKDSEWDSYRNHSVGFVFQNYNLIPHQSILSNVELALTLSGVDKNERKSRAIDALDKVGLKEHINKNPNQLSGGQMQRVAIARALINNPDILLADEPTGALDSETSVQVMNLLKEVAKDRLVIMVTHNPELAEEYATRIVKLKDGNIVDDTDPFYIEKDKSSKVIYKNMGKLSMSFMTSLSLSFNNLRTKKGRTLLTAFAGSIGIIGIALILALSAGVDTYIKDVQKETMASYPITIEEESIDINSILNKKNNYSKENKNTNHNLDGVYSNGKDLEIVSALTTSMSKNNLTNFKKYLDNPKSEINQYIGQDGIVYSYNTKFDIYTYDDNGELVNTDGSTLSKSKMQTYPRNPTRMKGMNTTSSNFQEIRTTRDNSKISAILIENYDLVYGKWPSNYNELLLILDENNEIPMTTLYEFGILPSSEYEELMKKIESGEEVKIRSKKLNYKDLCNKTFYLVLASDYYKKSSSGNFKSIKGDKSELESLTKNAVKLKITGIVRPQKDEFMSVPIGYTIALTDYIIENTNNSKVVKAQQNSPEKNILNGMTFEPKNDNTKIQDVKNYLKNLGVSERASLFKEVMNSQYPSYSLQILSMDESQLSMMLDSYLEDPDDDVLLSIYDKYISAGSYNDNMQTFGVVNKNVPSAISIYVDSFKDKEGISNCIANYNKTVDKENKITYTDLVGIMISSVTTIINMITYVLIAFVAVSLIVSSIMIGIITFISVLERTKEIGILRAIGASKRNISQVFNAETFIIGLLSGVIGVTVAYLLLIPINAIIRSVTGLTDITATLSIYNAIILIILSVILTLIGGFIPAKKAAKKDPVTALRTE